MSRDGTLDFGRSEDPRVQTQLDRLAALSVPQGRLGLETISGLLERLDDPHRKLPPVFHVAGTNGKGSVCAFLRAMLEGDGKKVHVTTSPHLVRYNERIRLAGKLIEDGALAELLEEVLDAGADLAPSFFEVTIAAAFLAFSRTQADACVVEVGLGGRFDATNVLEPEVLAACGIAALGIDHERFLLAPEDGVPEDPMARIAFEKAGIAKAGVPLVAMRPDGPAMSAIGAQALDAGAKLVMRGVDWHFNRDDERMHYRDKHGSLDLPLPSMRGAHQAENAALAIALLRHQERTSVSEEAICQGLARAFWPARLQLLEAGPLAGEREVWLDGGHNNSAGAMLGRHFRKRDIHLVLGMLESKDPRSIVEPLAERIRSLTVVPVPGHDYHGPEAYRHAARAAPDLAEAMKLIPSDGRPVLIAGSLYLAGEALRLNDQIPA